MCVVDQMMQHPLVSLMRSRAAAANVQPAAPPDSASANVPVAAAAQPPEAGRGSSAGRQIVVSGSRLSLLLDLPLVSVALFTELPADAQGLSHMDAVQQSG